MLTEDSKRKFLNEDKSDSKYIDDRGYCYALPKKYYVNKNIKPHIYFGDNWIDETSLDFLSGDGENLRIFISRTDFIIHELHRWWVFKDLRDVVNKFEKQNGNLVSTEAFIELLE